MGQDKASLIFGGETMLERAVRVMHEVADEVIVVARAEQPMPAGVRAVHDPVKDLGPLAGIVAGLSASSTDVNVIVACDMPLVRAAVLRRLAELRGDADICVAVADGHASPLCAVYRQHVGSVGQELLDAGERRVMALLDRVATKRVDAAVFRDLDPDLQSFISCDTPEAYQQALVRLKADATSALLASKTRSAVRPESGA